MAVAAFNLTTNGNNADATSYATASVSPTASRLILAWFASSHATVAPNIPTATGNGLTWVVVATRVQGTRRMTLFRSMSLGPTSGAITFDLAGQTADGAQWSVAEFSGINTTGSNGSGAITHKAVNSTSGATSLMATLSTFADTDDATAGAFFHAVNETTNVGSGFTSIGSIAQATPGASLRSEFLASNDTTVDASWTTSSAAIGIAVGIREASSVVVPMVFAAGALLAGTGAISPVLPLGSYIGDLLVMFVETNNETITVSGWTQAPNSPQSDTTDTTRLTVFYKWATGEADTTTTSDSGDHQVAAIVGVYGGTGYGNPFNATAGGTEATSDTSVSISGVTTTIQNTLVLAATTSARNATASNEFSGWTNANLNTIQEWIDGTDTAGLGGGIGMASGIYPLIGNFGSTTATAVTATRKALWAGAVSPPTYPAITQNESAFYEDGSESASTLISTGVMDSYGTANQNAEADNSDGSTTSGIGQTFTGNGDTIVSVTFYIRRSSTALTGTINAKLYAHSGTFGSTGVPTGAALATSGNIDVTVMGTSLQLVTFYFPTQYVTTSGTKYVVQMLDTISGGPNGTVKVGVDTTSPTHAGNSTVDSLGTDYDASKDTIFYVNSAPTRVLNGNSNLGVRFRLQNNAGDGQLTDDYQVQYSLNGGLYLSPNSALIDSYPQSNANNGYQMSGTFAYDGLSQSFTNVTANTLTEVVLYMYRFTGNPTGDVTVKIYAHSGTFGTSSVATGAALATSDPVPAQDLSSGSAAAVNFIFTGANQISLAASTNYVLAVEYTGGSSTNTIVATVDTTSPTHGGNHAQRAFGSGVWTAISGTDMIFYIAGSNNAPVLPYASSSLTDGGATTSRLGTGTGSFVAGKVSETGVVSNLQLTANNYTELLYSLTLVASKLAYNDILDFRAVRSGASGATTYAGIPRMIVQKVAGATTAISLSDDFNDNSTSASWTKADAADSSQVNEQNGRVEITHASTSQYNSLTTSGTYSMVDKHFYVKLADAGNQSLPSHAAIIGMHLDSNNVIWLDVSSNVISAYKRVAGTLTQIGSSIAYNSTTHAWFRFAVSGGAIYWDTSTDGTTWTNRWHTAAPFSMTAMYTYLQTGAWQTESSGSYAYFDNYNTLGSTALGYKKANISGTFVSKPLKVFNGSTWSVKPVKKYNGSTWTLTP